jgi:acyl-CoA thioesterase-1
MAFLALIPFGITPIWGMKSRWFAALMATLFAIQIAAFAQTAEPKKKAKSPKAPDPAFAAVTDEPGLPRVLLIGDSISIGYTIPVREMLKGKANVHRIPTNGGPTTTGLAGIDKWLGDSKWDVIHFNWGLHDLKSMDDGSPQVPLADYEKNLRKLVARLKTTGARLIWCSTTPVPDAKMNPPRKNEDVLAYNALAKKIMQENQIPMDDLYTHAAAKISEIQLPANVHYKKEGYEYLAKQVVKSLEDEMAKLGK